MEGIARHRGAVRTAFAGGLILALGASVPRAEAAAFSVRARTEAQLYEIRAYRGTDPSDPVLLPRRRIVQYLGLDAFELITGEDLGFETNLRIYSDFGLERGEAELIDGLRREDADLLYAYARWRTGGFELRAGRQYSIDALDYLSFDGVSLRYLTKSGLGAEAYAGLWVKSASFLVGTSSAFYLDGTRDTEGQARDGLFFAEEAGLEPLFGARLLGENVLGSGISASLGYRRSMIDGNVTSERAGGQLTYSPGFGVNLLTAVDYDLYIQRVATFRAQARWDGQEVGAQLEALRFAPTFSSYAIWYFFANAPRDELRLRADWFPAGPLRYYVQLTTSRFGTEINENTLLALSLEDPELSSPWVYGAGGGAQYRRGQVRSGLDVLWRNGYGGRQLWVDLTGGYLGGNGKWSLDGRFSVASVRDGRNELLRGNFYGAQLWGSYLLSPAARFSLVVEENVNPFTRSDTRAYLVFDLKAVL